jgi:hypothetical protein
MNSQHASPKSGKTQLYVGVYKRNRKGLESLLERFQGTFSTDRVAKEDGEKIDDLVVPETPPRKTHPLTDLGQDTMLAKMRRHRDDFLEYVIMPPFLIVWHVGLDIAARRSVVFHPLPSKRSSTACFCPGALR